MVLRSRRRPSSTVRVSSREAYVSPTRGAQGNALQTLLVMGFALDSQEPVETNSVVGPEVQQSPSGQVISESYRGQNMCYLTPRTAWSRLAPTWVYTSID